MSTVTPGRHPTASALPRAFTLVELLVVVSVLALLIGLLVPGLSKARDQAKAAVCGSNIRQIALANDLYANDHHGLYCPGAADFVVGNLHRWHGTRNSPSEPFTGQGGPLVPYLGPGGNIRACPSLRIDGPVNDPSRFEMNSGGYGYNLAFLGRRIKQVGFGFYVVEDDKVGALRDRVRQPAGTIMFTDAALVTFKLIDYSFAEPRWFPEFGSRPDPSIHFRHNALANAAWCDGHVDRHPRAFTYSSGLYPGDPDRFNLGWFGQRDDNSLFDLR